MKKLLIALAVVLAAGAGFLGYIGYFGGETFVPVAAKPQAGNPAAGLAAVVLSGDMGFRMGMGPKIAARLAADGIPVIGVNSLVYFRHRRSPLEVRNLVAAAIEKALEFGHADRVVLVGQSFGSDMIPVALSAMPGPVRAKIAKVIMVVPTDTLFLRASPSEMFNWSNPDADAIPGARRLTWIPVVCVSGARETTSLCPYMDQPNVVHVKLPGGHYLNGDVDALHRVISDAISSARVASVKARG
ncbi:AcvB/VirJ family lysyl-phosphatidylglycerol hydrolase [Novosphingobium sp. PY1]|uniref:AcvB/VirJ family lysyl-phosphatidylglycerol hydrolase n=1 Tax=Novosphingobium sp. PY1 TaxID=1882221 RepID=UPI001A8DDEA4|nr:AcvB/VirJ family lysyl-phosphatidylglycerol hydrolase [Novosphingobium sp. PY1]GFM28972.1 type IV secretory pathway VirJ component-like protein [Novosphingobium sp. PY1]